MTEAESLQEEVVFNIVASKTEVADSVPVMTTAVVSAV